MKRWVAVLVLSSLVCAQDEDAPPPPKPKRDLPAVLMTLATAKDAACGLLAWTDDEVVALRTERGERTLKIADLLPQSTWRMKSALAGRDAAKRLELAAFCKEKKLVRQARWEYAAARACDPNVAIPDLDDLRKQDAEAFMPGILALASDQVAKKLDAEAVEASAARIVAQKNQHETLKKKMGVTDVVTLVNNGDVSRRLDIVLICDGYSAADQPLFNTLAENLVKGLLKVEPMSNYPSYINFHRINIVEPASGIAGRKTKLGSKVSSNILTCDTFAAWEVAKLAPDAELICVIANVKNVRATGGGGVLTLDASGDIKDTAVHEMGHAFADLDDEYVDESVQDRYPEWPAKDEAQHINTTREPDPKRSKWHYWNAPIPQKGIDVACYEGAFYRAQGFFRPSQRCRMRSAGDPMCPVCFEQMEKCFYTLVSPVDSASPTTRKWRAFLDDDLVFSASAVVTEGKSATLGTLNAAWYVDGGKTDKVSSKDKTTFVKVRGSDLKPGTHEVALRIDFLNKRIRRDEGLLSGHRVWDVEVFAHNRPKIVYTGELGRGTLTAKAEGAAIGAGVRAALLHGAEGTEWEPTGAVTYKPDDALTGSFRVRFGFLDKDGALLGLDERSFLVARKDGKNLKPFLRLPPEIDAREGRTFYYAVQSFDPDGDHLTFTATGLPEGATIDSATGEIAWDLGYAQGGVYDGIKITVTDGQQQFSASTKIVVQDQPIAMRNFWAPVDKEVMSKEAAKLRDFDIILGLRSSDVELKRACVARLEQYGPAFRMLEYLRLLRDRDDSIVASDGTKLLSRTDPVQPRENSRDAHAGKRDGDPRGRREH